MPTRVELLCVLAVLFFLLQPGVHGSSEASNDVLRVLCVEPALLLVTSLVDELSTVALHTVVVGMDTSFENCNQRFVGLLTELVAIVQQCEHLSTFFVLC